MQTLHGTLGNIGKVKGICTFMGIEGVLPIKFGNFMKLEVSAVKEQNTTGEEIHVQDDPQRDKIYQVLARKWIAHLQINRIHILINLWQNKYITIKSDCETIKANTNVKFEVILVKHRRTLMSVQKLSVRS